MNEAGALGLDLRTFICGPRHALRDYLPDAFGPDLEIKTLLMDEQDHGFYVNEGDTLTQSDNGSQ